MNGNPASRDLASPLSTLPSLERPAGTGGRWWSRTTGLPALSGRSHPLSYAPGGLVGAPGFEPGASALSGPRSNQLSYAPSGGVFGCDFKVRGAGSGAKRSGE